MTDLQDTGSWRACGGAVVSGRRATSLARGQALFEAYAREAVRLRQEGRRAAARLCAAMALDIAKALTAADDWRCAATGLSRRNSPLRQVREFTCQVKLLRYG